jgi:hypothetical protein
MVDAWTGAKPEGGAPGGHIDGERIKRELALFIGPNANRYLKALKLTDKGTVVLQLSWHWQAAFLLIPWLFYRKLYVFGVLLFVAIGVSAVLFPDIPVVVYANGYLL